MSFDSVDNEAETGIQPRCGYAATVQVPDEDDDDAAAGTRDRPPALPASLSRAYCGVGSVGHEMGNLERVNSTFSRSFLLCQGLN